MLLLFSLKLVIRSCVLSRCHLLHLQAWEDQEDKFHLEQAKLRSSIRIHDSRAKPIDLLAQYASSAEEGAQDLSGVEMHEPYTYLNGLTMSDLEDLLEDIKVYMELEQGKLKVDLL